MVNVWKNTLLKKNMAVKMATPKEQTQNEDIGPVKQQLLNASWISHGCFNNLRVHDL